MIELSNGSILNTKNLAVSTTVVNFIGFHPVQGVRTAGVRPYLFVLKEELYRTMELVIKVSIGELD